MHTQPSGVEQRLIKREARWRFFLVHITSIFLMISIRAFSNSRSATYINPTLAMSETYPRSWKIWPMWTGCWTTGCWQLEIRYQTGSIKGRVGHIWSTYQEIWLASSWLGKVSQKCQETFQHKARVYLNNGKQSDLYHYQCTQRMDTLPASTKKEEPLVDGWTDETQKRGVSSSPPTAQIERWGPALANRAEVQRHPQAMSYSVVFGCRGSRGEVKRVHECLCNRIEYEWIHLVFLFQLSFYVYYITLITWIVITYKFYSNYSFYLNYSMIFIYWLMSSYRYILYYLYQYECYLFFQILL